MKRPHLKALHVVVFLIMTTISFWSTLKADDSIHSRNKTILQYHATEAIPIHSDPDGGQRVKKQGNYLQTIDDYNAFHPEQAERDATQHIKENTPLLFYLATEEVPTPVGISEDTTLPKSFSPRYIGSGCIDEIHSDDSPQEYKDAFNMILAYAKIYNKHIARHYGLPLTTDAKLAKPLPDNTTFSFTGPISSWNKLSIELRDIHPLFGGRQISIGGSGSSEITYVLMKNQGEAPIHYQTNLSSEDLHRLIKAFITNDFLTISLPEVTLEPDTACPQIILKKGEDIHQITGWVQSAVFPGQERNDSLHRFDSIYKELLRIERVLQEKWSQPLTE